MTQGGTRLRVILVDDDGVEVGTADVPLVIDSPALKDSVDRLLAEIVRLREVIELTSS
jgi:predicted NBD/HSP70 family sugar kinase